MKTEFLTPVGRFVQGDPFEAQTKNMQGQPLMTQSGQPTQRYFMAVAFKKTDTAFGALWQLIDQTARASFPGINILPPWDQQCRFSWKVMDGDGVDDNGKPNANKPGFAGCWVVKFSSSFAPRCFYAGKYAPHEQIQDVNAIKRGWYVRISGTIEGNANVQKPGVYVNLSMVELVGGSPADIIVTGPDASTVFGGQAAQLPPGVAALPMGGPAAGLPGMPGGVVAPQGLPAALPHAALPTALPGMQQQPVMPTGVLPPGGQQIGGYGAHPTMAGHLPPQVAVQPHPGILAGPQGVAMPLGLPQVPGAVPMMPAAPPMAPAAPQMTAKAGGFTREQYHQQGWTDDVLRAQGMMI